MKVLYLINHAGKAGTEKYVYNLINRFNGTDTECYFAFNEKGLLSEQMADMNIPSFNFEMKNDGKIGKEYVTKEVSEEQFPDLELMQASPPGRAASCYLSACSCQPEGPPGATRAGNQGIYD